MAQAESATPEDYGRVIVENGRWWLMPLPEQQIAHGARAVVNDPAYRQELARTGLTHATEIHDVDLCAAILHADSMLTINDDRRRAGDSRDTNPNGTTERGSVFGPEYPKIQTLWKRDDRNVVTIGDYSVPEFEYLCALPWRWTEKVDGTNIRLHWNGESVTVGGRTDNAQVPSPLVANLGPQLDAERWRAIFPDADDVTVYGEGYGAKIQSGGQYRQDQALIVFDVLVGRWWLTDENVADVANKLGLDVVPSVGEFSLQDAWYKVTQPDLASQWPGARIEGLVGRPAVDLFNRKGERIMAKVKVKDWLDYQRKGGGI